MGLITWLKNKMGEDKAIKMMAIIGGFLIFIVGNFPLAELIDGLGLKPAYSGYIILAWSAFVIAFSSITILFFGKSDTFPPAGTGVVSVVEEILDDVVEDVVDLIEDVIEPEVIPEEPIV